MLSPKTKGALIRALAGEGHSVIGLRALELGLQAPAVGGNRLDRSMALLRAVQDDFAPEDAEAKLVELADEILSAASPWQLENDEPVRALLRCMEIDGYSHVNGHLVPATPTPVAVQRAVSEVERRLEAANYPVALNHYRQAVDNYVEGNHEAANGQVRSCVEELFVALCQSRRGKAIAGAAGALQHLYSTDWLDKGEYNHYRHFWDDIQDNGPHRGLSSKDECLFRLHYATAMTLYLVTKDA